MKRLIGQECDNIKVKCPAKINLCLTILGKRADGYHEIRSLMVAVSLWDELHIRPSKHFRLVDEAGNPLDKKNTVWRTAKLFSQLTNKPLYWSVKLIKRIPSEAGLGGGSSDAAGILIALRQLWRLRLPWRSLVPLAVKVGADVPFFLTPTGAAIVEGIGERLKPIRLPTLWLILAKPIETMPTKNGFAFWDMSPVHINADPNALAIALQNFDWKAIRRHSQNAFETIISERLPNVAKLKKQLIKAGALATVISGTGTTIVGLFNDRMTALKGLDYVFPDAEWAQVVHSLHRSITVGGGDK